MDLRFRLSADGSTLDVSFAGRWRTRPPGRLRLHAPPVSGLRTLMINGRAVDAKGVIDLGDLK